MKSTKKNSDYFIETDSIVKTLPDVLQKLQSFISNKRVLFIGFEGGILEALNNNKLYYAIPSMLPVVRWPKIRPFKTVIIDPNAFPFAADVFDVVIVNHYLEFFDKNIKFLHEIFRILKRDGKFIAVIFNDRSLGRKKSYGKIKSVKDIIIDISETPFHLSNIWGTNKKARFLSCNFDYKQDKYSEMLIGFFHLLSDVLIITADKTDLASEAISEFKERYEMI
ncbi:MAG: class I SAM-dependent methyltransferase [Holosporaceae bacterium]|jgi:SAM-dependent methyltransferase|nr:class I SAM-dependent methyltransferase [Holosporaceae bacterium]